MQATCPSHVKCFNLSVHECPDRSREFGSSVSHSPMRLALGVQQSGKTAPIRLDVWCFNPEKPISTFIHNNIGVSVLRPMPCLTNLLKLRLPHDPSPRALLTSKAAKESCQSAALSGCETLVGVFFGW
jgi:hypothetical protein